MAKKNQAPVEQAEAKEENKEAKIEETKTEAVSVSEVAETLKDSRETKEAPLAKQPKAPERPLTKTERIKEALAKQPKVRIMIPREKGEKEGASETVQINGYTYQIMKGEYVDVPEQIARIIMESQQQTQQAIANALKKIPEDERMVFDNSK